MLQATQNVTRLTNLGKSGIRGPVILSGSPNVQTARLPAVLALAESLKRSVWKIHDKSR